MSIITEAPLWLIILCVLAGIIYAGVLYYKDRFNRTYGKILAALLALLRFTCVAFLSFFLMNPLIKTINRNIEKPVIVIAQDNSESLVIGNDSAYYKGQYQKDLAALIAQFGDEYDIKTYHFGNSVEDGIDSLNFNDKLTDFSGLLDEIYTRYSGRNLGAIVVASDGLYNKGSNPVYAYQKLNVPIYTIALGDTTVHKDVLLANVAVNRLAYLGNKFPMEITVEGKKANGENALLTVTRKGTTLYSENINFTDDKFFKVVPLTFDASEIGLQKYAINISTVKDEITIANNHKDVFIDVLDSRQKILILAYAPHPDLNAIREAVSSNESYKVDVKLEKDFDGNISEYSLVIFHQLPSAGNVGQSHITSALEKKIPSLFVWGSSTDFKAFNALNIGYSLDNYRNNSTDVSGTLANEFPMFTLSEEIGYMFKTMPPLTVPFGDYAFSPGASSLIYQQVGQIKTKKPLISFNKVNDTKVGLIAGEGLWRWRMTAFQQYETHFAFNEFITKIVQFTSAKEDKSLFRVTGKNDFPENEPIIFDAELYNASYEPINNRDVRMRIFSEEGKEYSYAFSIYANRYRLDAGQLPVGNYSYESTVNTDQGILKERGEFSVSSLQLETMNTVADHRMLYQFSHSNNGEMVLPQNMNTLPDLIKNKKEIVSVSYENKQLDDLIDFKWLLLLFIILLSTEWLLRKRAGTY